MNDPRQGCVAVRVIPNPTGGDFTVAAERHCIAPNGCWWPKCSCDPWGAARPAIEERYTRQGAAAPHGASNPYLKGSAAATWWQRGNDGLAPGAES